MDKVHLCKGPVVITGSLNWNGLSGSTIKSPTTILMNVGHLHKESKLEAGPLIDSRSVVFDRCHPEFFNKCLAETTFPRLELAILNCFPHKPEPALNWLQVRGVRLFIKENYNLLCADWGVEKRYLHQQKTSLMSEANYNRLIDRFISKSECLK